MKTFEGYRRGVNLGGWISQCPYEKSHYDTFITDKDFADIKAMGFDHVRVPVDFNVIENEDGSFSESGFAYIRFAIDTCRKYGLKMILDLHKTRGFSFDNGEKEIGFFGDEKYQEYFYSVWTEFSKRFGKESDMLAFELLNEVTDAEYNAPWNRIFKECVKKIRVNAPDTKILMGGYFNNSAETVKYLDPPVDKNIVYNFHCYEPIPFTHQGAPWVEGMPLDFRISFNHTYSEVKDYYLNTVGWCKGTPDDVDPDKDILAEPFYEMMFKDAIAHAEKYDVPLYCGEYGVIELATPEDTLKWYTTITNVFRKYGIGTALWTYKGKDFGFVAPHLDPVRADILKELMK